MTENNSNNVQKSAAIRAEFDKILMRHISSLIDTREDIAALPFNLATIASLLLLAERENEIKSFPESPPERYTRETFFSDIEEIGLELDDDLMEAIQNLGNYGFVVINEETQYMARESASLLILLLDSIFPQMPGMNLVAYVSQAIEEVTSGRKEEARALQHFDQTLDKQGVRLSAIPESQLGASATQRILPPEAPDPEVLKERRAAYLQRLKALRARNLSTDSSPTVVAGGASIKHVKIKELFQKSEAEPEPPPSFFEPPAEAPPPPPETHAASAPPAGEPMSTPQSPEPPPTPGHETTPDPIHARAMDPFEPEGGHIPGLQEEEASQSTFDKTAVDGLTAEGESASIDAQAEPVPLPETPASGENFIEAQIRQFEEDLAMPCPICGEGKVISDTTEKGKTYYHCSNESCRLISWGKPYPLDCPVCKNPFLIEVPGSDGRISLKCPRATCMYRRDDANAVLSGDQDLGKKKVAVVKKKRKKGVRRVVRRKR